MGCKLILGASIPGFFLSSYFTMLLWGVISSRIGITSIGYVDSMLVTITLWIAVVPLVVAGSRRWIQY